MYSLKFYFLIFFLYLSTEAFSKEYQNSEAKLFLSAQMPRICNITTKLIAAPLNIIPQKNCSTEHYMPHVFSIFLTYNGSSSMRLILLPDQDDKTTDKFFFVSSSNPNHKMYCSLINLETEETIPEYGVLYCYSHDVPNPIIAKEFKIGIKIFPKEIRKAHAGVYNCHLKATIREGD